MASQNIESLILIPSRREVLVKYKNGKSRITPVFPNDQTLLETAKSNGIRAGIYTLTSEYALRMIKMGFDYVVLSSDARMIVSQAQKILTEVRFK